MKTEKPEGIKAEDIRKAVEHLKAHADPNPPTPEEVAMVLSVFKRHEHLLPKEFQTDEKADDTENDGNSP